MKNKKPRVYSEEEYKNFPHHLENKENQLFPKPKKQRNKVYWIVNILFFIIQILTFAIILITIK